MTLELTQLLTEMSSSYFPGVTAQPVHKADNLAAVCEPFV
jgi:hypothetical protein